MELNYASGKLCNLPDELYPGTLYFITDKKRILFDPIDGSDRIDYLVTSGESEKLKIGTDLIPSGRIIKYIDRGEAPVIDSDCDEVLILWAAPSPDATAQQIYVHQKDGIVEVGVSHGSDVSCDEASPWVTDFIIYRSDTGVITPTARLEYGIRPGFYVSRGQINSEFDISTILHVMTLPSESLDQVNNRLTQMVAYLCSSKVSNSEVEKLKEEIDQLKQLISITVPTGSITLIDESITPDGWEVVRIPDLNPPSGYHYIKKVEVSENDH